MNFLRVKSKFKHIERYMSAGLTFKTNESIAEVYSDQNASAKITLKNNKLLFFVNSTQ